MTLKNKIILSTSITLSILISFSSAIKADNSEAKIKKITISTPYAKGGGFSVETLNFGDLKDDVEVYFSDNKKAQVTGKENATLQGILPEGINPRGGKIRIKANGKNAELGLKIPYITSVYFPGNLQIGDEMIISGGNFDPKNCQAKIDQQSLKINSCDYTQIKIQIENKLTGGVLTITSGDFISAPYPIEVSTPQITVVESVDGIRPGGRIRIHGSGLKTSGSAPEVLLDTLKLGIISAQMDNDFLEVQLPETSFVGQIKVVRNGLESNTVTIQSQRAPIITSYSEQRDESGKVTLGVKGKNFSPTAAENTVYIDKSSSAVTYAEVNTIMAPIPSNISSGCLFVMTNNVSSNCLYYEPKEGPVVSEIGQPGLDNEGNYRVTLSGFNFNEKTTAFALNSRQEVVSMLGNSQLTLLFQTLPKSGTMYVVTNGIKSNEMEFDFSEVGIPVINSITAPQGFSPGQKIILTGTNFGRQSDREKINLYISNGGLREDIKITPYSIEAYLDTKGVLYQKTTFYLTFNGEKSNEIQFSFDPSLKSISRGPILKKIIYPEGIKSGSAIIIEGSGFSTPATNNLVHLGDQKSPALSVKNNKLTVLIPENSSKGELFVSANNQESNRLTFIAAPRTGNPLEMRFETLEKDSFSMSDSGSIATVARVSLLNHVGKLKVKQWAFDIIFKDNADQFSSLKKSGVLPLGAFELKNNSLNNFSSSPLTGVALCTQGKCKLTFKNFTLEPSAEKQIFDFSTNFSSFAQDGSRIALSLSPEDTSSFSVTNNETGLLLNPKIKTITSPEFTIYNQTTKCFDSERDQHNCNAFFNGIISVTPKASSPATANPNPKTPSSTIQNPNRPSKPEPPKTTNKRTRKVLVSTEKTDSRPVIPFRDAGTLPWAERYLNEFKKMGIASVNKENLFYPEKSINRLDFLVYTLKALQINPPQKTDLLTIRDISKSNPNAKYVLWALQNGIIKNPADKMFHPRSPLKRAEAVIIILAAGGFKIDATEESGPAFTDLTKEQKSWVAEAHRRGIAKGVSETSFGSNQSLSRAEAVKMILETIKQYRVEVAQDQEIDSPILP